MMGGIDRHGQRVAAQAATFPPYITLRVTSCPLWFIALVLKERSLSRPIPTANNLGELGLSLNRDGMRDRYVLASLVIYFRASGFGQELRDVLHQRAFAENVQALQPITDAEHGLAVSVGIFKKKIVYFFSPEIRGC